MSCALFSGDLVWVAFDSSLSQTVALNGFHACRGLLTAEYEGYSFTMDIEPSVQRASVSLEHVGLVVGLDWIGSFRAVIRELYPTLTQPSSVDSQIDGHRFLR